MVTIPGQDSADMPEQVDGKSILDIDDSKLKGQLSEKSISEIIELYNEFEYRTKNIRAKVSSMEWYDTKGATSEKLNKIRNIFEAAITANFCKYIPEIEMITTEIELEHLTARINESMVKAESLLLGWVRNDLLLKLEISAKKLTLKKILGCPDKNKLETNRIKYGAKAAYLIEFKNLIIELAKHEETQELAREVSVPTFEIVDTKTYQEWVETGSVPTVQMQAIYEKFKGEPIIIRSSAVYSEDGENCTGAGIYESITLTDPEYSFEEFLDAAIEVYKSTNSDLAIRYRQNHGIQKELMGLVIQKYSEGDLFEISTVRAFTPDLMSVDSRYGNLIINRSKWSERVFKPDNDHSNAYILEIQCDSDFDSGGLHMAMPTIEITQYLELYFGRPILVEAIVKNSYGESSLVQVRPIPEQMTKFLPIEFPDADPIYTSKAIGRGDAILELLDANDDNQDKTGVVIYRSGSFGSFSELYKALPQKGAVILMEESRKYRGHIETIAMERSLTLFYPGQNADRGKLSVIIENTAGSIRQTGLKLLAEGVSYLGEEFKSLRVVSDGSTGRIYKP